MKEIIIVEFPSNLGLIEPSKGHEPGVRKLPSWLREHGFHELIGPAEIHSLEAPTYTMQVDPVSGVRNADAIIQYSKDQADLIQKIIAPGKILFVLGGDCSILTGNALALKKLGNYGLFFLDGHTDFITPELSGTAGAAGMDLAIVTGHGHPKLTNIDGLKPYIEEENCYCVGNREYDEDYERPVKESSVRYLDLLSLRNIGIENCVVDFQKMVEAKGLNGYWVHIDVDVLDDEQMPAVDSRTAGGLSYNEFNSMLRLLMSHPKFTGLEITILDPELDPDGKHTRKFVQQFCDTANSVRTNAKVD